MASGSYRGSYVPGGFLFEGLSDDEDDFHQSKIRTVPRHLWLPPGLPGPIARSRLAAALASAPESSSRTRPWHPGAGTQHQLGRASWAPGALAALCCLLAAGSPCAPEGPGGRGAAAAALAPVPSVLMHPQLLSSRGHPSGTSPVSSSVQSGTPITGGLFSQALQHALQASGQPSRRASGSPSSSSRETWASTPMS